MTEQFYLTRASLKRDAEIGAIARLLAPDEDDARIAANHRLAWSLFSGNPGKVRDFLWREEAPGRLIILSPSAPEPGSAIFDVETCPFAREPRNGERLAFALRANPTVSLARHGRKANGKRRSGKPVDVIMHALHSAPGRRGADGKMHTTLRAGEGRAFLRDALVGWLDDEQDGDPRRPALDWLTRQGEGKGFRIDRDLTQVVSYRRVALPRSGKERPAVIGQVDFEGILTVTDERAFAMSLRAGFGRAKAFGHGLMLLAPAPLQETGS
ncbi:MAG: type I-E CRISPR-associated protein Cas6/Cse3/CasE [Beijerinckiaceae bacterium]